jgi:myxalamid-type polyketide synthase MxaE and MxaD
MGEVAAAHIAGALSLEDAARIICRRSRLARKTSGRGAMAVVDLSLAQSIQAIAGYESRLAVAVSNSPTSTVLSGDPEALEEVLAGLERDGIFCRRIKVDYASHSPQMDPLRDDLLAMLDGVAPRRTVVPLYSTVTGTIAAGQDLGAAYWVRNLREPVLFAPVIERLLKDGCDVFLEISPHPILTPAIQQSLLSLEKEGLVLGSLRRDEEERPSLLATLANLYAIGKSVEWNRLYHPAEPSSLPPYPWQHERFWFDESAAPATPHSGSSRGKHPLIGEHIRFAAEPATHLWRRTLSAKSFPFLTDHRLFGEMVVPAGVYLEMALEAVDETLGDAAAVALEDVRFERALVLGGDEARPLQLVLTSPEAGGLTLQVFSEMPPAAADKTGRFVRHVSASIQVSADGQRGSARDALPVIQARCSPIEPAEHYRHMADMQVGYGPAFQCIDALWTGNGEALARLTAPPERRYRMHPAMLDAVLQVLAASLPADTSHVLVPVLVDRFRVWPPGASPGLLWAHAVSRSVGAGIRGDVLLVTDTGELVAEASGIALEPLDPFASTRAVNADADIAPVDSLDTPPPTRAELLAATPDVRAGLLTERLRQHAGRVLRLPAAHIDPDQPLLSMGIDSLMAVELKGRIERETGVQIPLLQLIKGPSLSELARILGGLVAGDASGDAAQPASLLSFVASRASRLQPSGQR